MYDDLFAQSAVFNLMTTVSDDLIDPGLLFERPPAFQIGVRGKLLIDDLAVQGTYLANCTFIGSTDWHRLPLKVFCTEKWIRQEVDWHLIKDKIMWYLCYEFPDRWADRIASVRRFNDTAKVIEYAAKFCIYGARRLIEKHLFAHRHNITEWPSEWPAWPHGLEAARQQYRNELLTAR